MASTVDKWVVTDVFLEKEQGDEWQMVIVGDDNQQYALSFKDTSLLSQAIHQMTHMLPMKRLKEEDKQELIFAMEQIMPHIYRNYVLDEYVLD